MMGGPPRISVKRLDDEKFEVRMRSSASVSASGLPRMSRARHTGWSGTHRTQTIVRAATPYSQQSIVMVQSVKKGAMQSRGGAKPARTTLAEHAWYLEEEKEREQREKEPKGQERDGEREPLADARAKFFNATEDSVRTKRDMFIERERLGEGWDLKREVLTKEMANSWESKWARERHHFRIVVSPENGAKLDMRQHIRDLMAQMERDQGTKLEWNAVIHRDTDHVHAQIVLRGKRDDGKTLYLPREYITQGLRHRSQELATKELGLRYRDAQMIAAERERMREQRELLKGLTKQEARWKEADISPSVGV